MRQIRRRASEFGGSAFEVDGLELFSDRDDWLVVDPDDLDEVSALSLQRALAAHVDDMGGGWRESRAMDTPTVDLHLPVTPYDDIECAVLSDVHLRCRDERLTVCLMTDLRADEPDESAESQVGIRRLLGPLSERLATPIVSIGPVMSVEPPTLVVELAPPIARRSVGAVLAVADEFNALLHASDGVGLVPATVADLVRSGSVSALLGQPESDWLEAKAPPPRLDDHHGKLEFAKDVASFANTVDGGILVYGLRTAKQAGGDVIQSARPFPVGSMRPTQLLAILRKRLRPVPLGLQVEVIEVDEIGQALGFVLVPPQDRARQPFLVHGVSLGGRVRETFVGIPYRVGEETVWEDPSGIHSLLAAGRAALAVVHAE